LKFNDNLITDFAVSFNERTTADNRFRKDRAKKVYRILNDDIKKMKYNLYPSSYVPYPLLFSIQKEYDIYFLFPYLDSGKYDTFVDVFFSTGNFYFFLNLPNNVINIPNLPMYAFYKSIQKGNSQRIYDYVSFVPGVEIKDKYEYCKKELNKSLLKYEQDTSNEEVELEVAQNYYFLSKGSNKQTVKFKNKKVVSLFNQYVTKVEPDKEMKDFYIISHITKSNILYCFNYGDILSKCDCENVIVFIDIIQQIMNF
jgi:hypothetical protein